MWNSCPVDPVAPILQHMLWSCMFQAHFYQSQMCASGHGLSEIADSQQLRYLLHCQISLLFYYLNIFRATRKERNLDQSQLVQSRRFPALLSYMVHSESCLTAAVYKMLMCSWSETHPFSCIHSLCSLVRLYYKDLTRNIWPPYSLKKYFPVPQVMLYHLK